MDKNGSHNRKEDAATALVKAFMPYIRKRASRIKSVGLAYDDIVQEGLIGLLSAVDSYEEGRGASFETYAITCIDNRIYTALRQDARKKNRPLNDYTPLSDEEGETRNAPVSESPEELYILRETVRETIERINRNLSSFEKDVLALYLEGYSYLAISELLSSSPKSVDNALQRARRKLK